MVTSAVFQPITPEILAQLTQITGNISTAKADLDLHAKDQSQHPAHVSPLGCKSSGNRE